MRPSSVLAGVGVVLFGVLGPAMEAPGARHTPVSVRSIDLTLDVATTAPSIHDSHDRHAHELAGGDSAHDDWWTTDQIPADDGVMVGADWGGGDAIVAVRARQDGHWTAWYELQPSADLPGGQEGDDSREHVSESMWFGESDAFQVRSNRRVDLELFVVGLDVDAATQASGPASVAAADVLIRPRSAWGADESLRLEEPYYASSLEFGVIHHEGGVPRWSDEAIANGCTAAPAAIRSIYAYHTLVRGYWDIAYNFIVDPCGTIWEGRYGGVNKNVVGAHAGGFNWQSFGVLALGTFSDQDDDPITDAMTDAIEDVFAYKFSVNGVDPHGTFEHVGGCTSCSSLYGPNTTVELPRVSAHQVTNYTSCPGDRLLDRLFDGSGSDARPETWFVENIADKLDPSLYVEPENYEYSVSDIQRRLAELGYYDGAIDGEYGPATTEAVRQFQEDHGLEADGVAGPATLALLMAGQTPTEGEYSVSDIQRRLAELGYYDGSIDGEYGPGTTEAVRWFQEVHGLEADGIAGSATLEVLMSSQAQPAPDTSGTSSSIDVQRWAGNDRIETAVEVSRESFDRSDVALLATSRHYADGLVATPLAGIHDAPVLLSGAGSVPPSVLDELDRLNVDRVILVGGQVALGPGVVTDLVDHGMEVDRIAGDDRYETAEAVAAAIRAETGERAVLIASGGTADPAASFPDALSAATYGAATGAPVLLVTRTYVPVATRRAIQDGNINRFVVFGGHAAVSEDVENRIEDYAGGDIYDTRFAGGNRYETAALAMSYLVDRDILDGSEVLVASGMGWPDAISGAAAAGNLGHPLVLVHPTADYDGSEGQHVMQDWATDQADVLGGELAVSEDVVDAIAG